ncbi:MAG: 3'(2'),5'-bisphosphate nucleotidase CysQ [Pseudomonadota bacterium]
MFERDDLAGLQSQVEGIAREAGDAVMAIYQGSYDIERKADHSPVTEADFAANDIINKRLEGIGADWPILSEENEIQGYEERRQWSTYWLVDPLDGTKEFIKGNGEFSVNIALVHQHEAILGVVYAPVLGATYSASRDNGAEKVTAEGRQRIHVRAAPKTPHIAVSRSHDSDRLHRFLEELGEHHVVHMGSSLKSCLVAEGTVDLYPRLGKTSEWDTGACQCVVEEAGGYFMSVDGERLSYNHKASLINPEFFVFGDNSRSWLAPLD